jgi:hypothetical protein
LVLEEKLGDNPDFASTTARFDAFGVYGDVNGDAIIMATTSTAWESYKWTIKKGVASKAELIILDNTQAGTFLPGVATPGTAPQTYPVDENYFYVDGQAMYPTLFDMDGAVVDGLFNCPTGAGHEDWAAVAPDRKDFNGLCEFEVAGEYFFLMSYMRDNVAAPNPPSSFKMFKFKDGNREFKDMTPLWVLPAAGMGRINPTYKSAIPTVEVKDKTATIYLYVGENGYGAYEFRTDGGTGIKPVNSDVVRVGVSGNTILLSENVASIRVFNPMGQMLQKAQGVSSINIAQSGIYIVTIQTLKGETVTKKVIIK